MSKPLRVNDALFMSAETEGALMKRSAAKQVEYWAELGRRISSSIAPNDMISLMQGIAQVRIDLPGTSSIDSQQIFTAVETNATQSTGSRITGGGVYYEASQNKPGLLDQVMPDGSRSTGHFEGGEFIPK